MPDQPVEIAHPPQALLRVLNPALHLALQTPLGPALKDFMVVSFTGRKTGRHFSVNTIPSVAEFTAAANGLGLAAIRLTPSN